MTESKDPQDPVHHPPLDDPASSGGRRSAGTTRRAILTCARAAFEGRPYNEVSLKEIAADAGVSAPLIIKYFGSKEQLYEEQLDFSSAAAELADVPVPELGHAIIRAAITSAPDSSSSLVHLLAVAGGNAGIVEALGRTYREQVVDLIARKIRDEAPNLDDPAQLDAQGRAECAVAMAVGASLMRRLVTRDYFDSEEAARFLTYYGDMVQAALEGRTGA